MGSGGTTRAHLLLLAVVLASSAGCVAAPVVDASSLTGAPAAHGTAPPAPPSPLEDQPPPTVACTGLDLPVHVAARDAAMGLRVLVLEVTNCSDTAVLVEGYPALGLRDADQQAIAVATTHGTTGGVPDPGPVPVELAPGARARAALSWRNTVTEGTAQTAEHLVVDPTPDDADAAQDRGEEGGQVLDESVDIGTTATIDVTAWQPAP